MVNINASILGNESYVINLNMGKHQSLPTKPIFFRYVLISLLCIIISVGIFGNMLNLLIFSRKNMRQVSTFRFLLYISVSDLLVLLIGATQFLINAVFHFDMRSTSPVVCKLHTFLTYFFTHTSSVLLMVLSIERALIMCKSNISSMFTAQNNANNAKTKNPSHNPAETSVTIDNIELDNFKDQEQRLQPKSNPQMAAISHHKVYLKCFFMRRYNNVDFTILITMSAIALLNLHYILFLSVNQKEDDHMSSAYENMKLLNELNLTKHINFTSEFENKNASPSNNMCFPLRNTSYFKFIMHVWIWIDLIVYSAIPFIIMSGASVIILIMLKKRSFNYFNHIRHKNRRFYRNFAERVKNEKQIIYILLVNNFYFLLTLLPYCIVFVIYRGSKKESETQKLIELFVYILLYTNNAFNFLLYGITSKNYRVKLKGLFFKQIAVHKL